MKKRILVTGATSGIGRATALRLSEPNVELIITGRRMDRLMALKSEIEARGAECHVLNFDVRSEQECIDNLTPLGRVDILINNAGLAAGLEHIDRGDTADWDAMIDTNVKGLLYVTRIISRAMVEAGQGGHIINIGSIAGTEPYENGAVYCASKHAIHGFYETIALEYPQIKTTILIPGRIHTDVSKNALDGEGRATGIMDPGQANGYDVTKCARKAIRAIARCKHQKVIGGFDTIMVPFYRYIPWLFRLIARNVSAR